MFTKIKNRYQRIKEYALQLRDVRVVGLLLFLVVVLMISWSGVKVIETNYQLQRDIAQLQQENELQELANENLKLENEYFDTPQYLELAARKDFGLAAPGESVVIVPRAVAMSYTVDPPSTPQTPALADEQRPTYERNFQAWMDFFFHRKAEDN